VRLSPVTDTSSRARARRPQPSDSNLRESAAHRATAADQGGKPSGHPATGRVRGRPTGPAPS